MKHKADPRKKINKCFQRISEVSIIILSVYNVHEHVHMLAHVDSFMRRNVTCKYSTNAKDYKQPLSIHPQTTIFLTVHCTYMYM